LTHDGTAWRVQTSDTSLTAETVFLATGKHDLRDQPRPHSPQDAIGLKTYLSLAPGPAERLDGTTELTLFPGGYAGMQFVENRQAVLCIAIKRQAFQGLGGNWPSLLAAIERDSPRFAMMLAGSRPLLPRPLAVAGIPYGYQSPPGALFRLGDQAAVIPSLTGDGMAIALHSGQYAARSWLNGIAAAAYQRALVRTLTPQMRLAGLLHRTGMSAPIQGAALPILRLFPFLLRQAAYRTRIRSPHDGLAATDPLRSHT
jgi:flavin-dependent dehydrogenase